MEFRRVLFRSFKATPRWTIEGFGCHLLRPIIVAGKTLLDIMVVGIALAITDVLHQLGRRVQNVLRRHQRSRVAGGFPCGLLRRSEEHTSELQYLMRISYAVFCLKKKTTTYTKTN